MRITAVTKFKNAELWTCLKKAGWSMAELSRKIQINYHHLRGVINIKRRPSEKLLLKIQAAFGEVGIFLDVEKVWPEKDFEGFDHALTIEQTADVEEKNLLAYGQHLQIMNEGTDHNLLPEYAESLQEALRFLTQTERKVLEMWMDDPDNTNAELADRTGVTTACIYAVKLRILRKLRWHVPRIKEHLERKDHPKMTADEIFIAMHTASPLHEEENPRQE